MDDEFRFHIQTKTDELVADSMQPADARREALRQFGTGRPVRGNVTPAEGAVGKGAAQRVLRGLAAQHPIVRPGSAEGQGLDSGGGLPGARHRRECRRVHVPRPPVVQAAAGSEPRRIAVGFLLGLWAVHRPQRPHSDGLPIRCVRLPARPEPGVLGLAAIGGFGVQDRRGKEKLLSGQRRTPA